MLVKVSLEYSVRTQRPNFVCISLLLVIMLNTYFLITQLMDCIANEFFRCLAIRYKIIGTPNNLVGKQTVICEGTFEIMRND